MSWCLDVEGKDDSMTAEAEVKRQAALVIVEEDEVVVFVDLLGGSIKYPTLQIVKGCGVSLRIGREQLESQPRNMQGTARSQNQKCGFLPGDNQEGKGVPEGESCNLHVL